MKNKPNLAQIYERAINDKGAKDLNVFKRLLKRIKHGFTR